MTIDGKTIVTRELEDARRAVDVCRDSGLPLPDVDSTDGVLFEIIFQDEATCKTVVKLTQAEMVA